MNNCFQTVGLISFYLFNFVSLLTAQTDTLYFTSQESPTTKEKAFFYRIVKVEGITFDIRDFYIKTNLLRKEGTASSASGDQFIGTYYKYSRKEHKLWYKINYLKEGVEYHEFYDKQGRLKADIQCIDGKRNGQATYYNDNEKIYGSGIFKNDELIKGIVPIPHNVAIHNETTNFLSITEGDQAYIVRKYANGTVAATGPLVGYYHMSPVTYFDSEGKKIGQCTYKIENYKSIPVTGIHVDLGSNIDIMRSYPPKVKLIREYINEKKIKEKTFSSEGVVLGEGTFKDNLPYNGCFFEQDLTTAYENINYYKKGKKLLTKYYINTHFKVYMYNKFHSKNPGKGKVTFYNSKGKVIAKGQTKNFKPYKGTFKIRAELLKFKEGKKEGKAYSYFRSNVKSKEVAWRIFTYKNDLLDGEVIFFNESEREVARGIYKLDKPFQGAFIMQHDWNRILFYEKGQLYKERVFLGDVGLLLYEINFFENTYTAYDGASVNLGTRKFSQEEQLPTLYGEEVPISDGPNWIDPRNRTHRQLFNYKDSKKHGKSILKDLKGRTEQIHHYKEGVKDGEEISYYKNEVFKGIYKEGKPYQGSFIIDDKLVQFNEGRELPKK